MRLQSGVGSSPPHRGHSTRQSVSASLRAKRWPHGQIRGTWQSGISVLGYRKHILISRYPFCVTGSEIHNEKFHAANRCRTCFTQQPQRDMSGHYETRTVRLIGIRCHCYDVRQRASADSDICFTVRVHRVSRHKSLDRQNRFIARRF
jgi:hypothetical protein